MQGDRQSIPIDNTAATDASERDKEPQNRRSLTMQNIIRPSAIGLSADDAKLTPPLGRRDRSKQEKLQRILKAAKHLFDAKGFAETTTQEIAERADIGTGTLFLYAKSKEDLLVMVFSDEMLTTSQHAFATVPATASATDRLMHVFNTMIAYHGRDLALARVLLKEVAILTNPARREDIGRLMNGIYGGILALIAAGHDARPLKASIDPMTATDILFSIYFNSLIAWLSGHTSKPVMLKRLRNKLAISLEGFVTGTPQP